MSNQNMHPVDLRDVLHPGRTVAEYLEHHDWSQRDLARRTGLTPKTISEIKNGHGPISPATAIAFERVFGRPASFWLGLQRVYDEAIARQTAEVTASRWQDWLAQFPLKDMRRLRYIPATPRGRTDMDVLLTFLGVASPESWDDVWQSTRVAFRQTKSVSPRDTAIAAWVRETEIAARQLAADLPFGAFDETALKASIDSIRSLTLRKTSEVVEPLQRICAAAGVAVVLVPELPGTGISGSARWLNRSRGLIALTLRYRTDDQLWFTFFHELGHILLHRSTHRFVLDSVEEGLRDGVVDPNMQRLEEEANRFAADTLIDANALSWFIRAYPEPTVEQLMNFSGEMGVGPGIVVGRLQHEGVLGWHQGHPLKQRLSFGFSDAEEPES